MEEHFKRKLENNKYIFHSYNKKIDKYSNLFIPDIASFQVSQGADKNAQTGLENYSFYEYRKSCKHNVLK